MVVELAATSSLNSFIAVLLQVRGDPVALLPVWAASQPALLRKSLEIIVKVVQPNCSVRLNYPTTSLASTALEAGQAA